MCDVTHTLVSGAHAASGFGCGSRRRRYDRAGVAVRCSVLHCVAVCCSVGVTIVQVLQCVAMCCSVLQCVAVCCIVLQCVAVCCSVLQCVAVCCSVLQCRRYYRAGLSSYTNSLSFACARAYACSRARVPSLSSARSLFLVRALFSSRVRPCRRALARLARQGHRYIEDEGIDIDMTCKMGADVWQCVTYECVTYECVTYECVMAHV